MPPSELSAIVAAASRVRELSLDHDSADTFVVALAPADEVYIFFYDDAHRQEAFQALGRYASNPDLSFNWRNVANASQAMREATNEAALIQPRFTMPRIDS
jgi:hypothetical protein